MKALILSASTGGGHMSAANAIKEYLIFKGESAIVIDAPEYISHIMNKTVNETYEYLATKQPYLWKWMYKTSNRTIINKLVTDTNSLISRKLLPLIKEHKPDVIITTHPFTTEMISKLKSVGEVSQPLICVMTDYAPHRTWINKNVDAYITANEGMVNKMSAMGVNKLKIHPFGIPVKRSFFEKTNKQDFLKSIGLTDELPVVLIMAGNYGYGNVENIYRKLQMLETEFQIVIITGKNPKLYRHMLSVANGTQPEESLWELHFAKNLGKFKRFKIAKKLKPKTDYKKIENTKKTKVIYFTTEVNKYMQCADLIITKPGGLTVSEALACNLPMVLFDPIPGQEEENAEFLTNKNMAIIMQKDAENYHEIEHLLTSPEALNAMKKNCENFDKSKSLENIFNLAKELINE